MPTIRKMLNAFMGRKKKGSTPEGFGKIIDSKGKDVTGDFSAEGSMPKEMKKKSKLRIMIDMFIKPK